MPRKIPFEIWRFLNPLSLDIYQLKHNKTDDDFYPANSILMKQPTP